MSKQSKVSQKKGVLIAISDLGNTVGKIQTIANTLVIITKEPLMPIYLRNIKTSWLMALSMINLDYAEVSSNIKIFL